MKAVSSLLIAIVLASCTSDKYALTRQEAELRADAAIRSGRLIKDEREIAILTILKPGAPAKATKTTELARLNPRLIEKRAIKNANEYPFANLIRQYNEGKISRQEYDDLCFKVQYYAAQQKAEKQARSNAIAASIGAGIVAHNQRQQVSPYQLPAFRALDAGIGSYDPDSLANPYGAGSPYKADGLMNPYSRYGSKYSNDSWTNPYATNAPKIVDENGKYHGRMSANKYDPDSTSNPYGRYGSKYSPDSINNPYGAGNPYSGTKLYVAPQP